MVIDTGPGGHVVEVDTEMQPAAGFPRGIAREATPLGFSGGDLLIYKSVVVLSGAALPLIAGMNWFLRGTISWPQLTLDAIILACAGVCWLLSRSGRREVAAALLIGLLWCSATIYAFQTGYGMHSAVIFVYLPCVLYTALFFGLGIAAAELALTIAALVTMYLAEADGRLAGAALFAAQGTSFNFLLGVILTSAGTLIVSLVYHRRIERDTLRMATVAEQRRIAMEQAQMAQAQLETANARLQSLNAELAERSRQHELATVRARRDFDLAHDVLAKDIPESLNSMRASLAAPDERTEKRLLAGIVRIEAMVGALGELSRYGEPELQREPVDLSAIAGTVARELRARATYARVVFDVDGGLRAHADRAQATSLMRHLIKRAAVACHAEPDPVVHVGSGSLEGQPVFYVRDNGPGMDETQRKKIFRPFERDGTENTVDIGIVSARRIAERHGGELDVDSAPGQGTTFFFSLGG